MVTWSRHEKFFADPQRGSVRLEDICPISDIGVSEFPGHSFSPPSGAGRVEERKKEKMHADVPLTIRRIFARRKFRLEHARRAFPSSCPFLFFFAENSHFLAGDDYNAVEHLAFTEALTDGWRVQSSWQSLFCDAATTSAHFLTRANSYTGSLLLLRLVFTYFVQC